MFSPVWNYVMWEAGAVVTTSSTEVGRVLQGRYRLTGVIGHGGSAVVYAAIDELLGRDVAVKMFRSLASDREQLQAQQAEARLVAGLNHPGLVTLLDAGVDLTVRAAPQLFLVMERVSEMDLRQRLQAGALGAAEVAYLGLDLAGALEYLQEHQVVHRDIKPGNVLLTEGGGDRPFWGKLTDFGIALLQDRADDVSGEFTTGTAAYLSPEQASGEPVGPHTDVYSLGLVLLEAATGRVAFPGGVVDSALARLDRDPEIPSTVPQDLAAILRSMTARSRQDRPTPAELVLAFRQLVIGQLGRAKPVDPSIIPEDEAARMGAVRRYDLLDTPPDGTFDHITALAARLFQVPIAIVSIVDHDRIWFKSHQGVAASEVGRDRGLCASAILDYAPLHITDARHDPRTLANPLVAGDLGIQFYAGVPLTTHDGYNLGTLCILDQEPRTLTTEQLAVLQDLAGMVMREMELRLATRRVAAAA